MPYSEGLSEAKRALLEQYLNGELPRAATLTLASTVEESPEPVDDTPLKVPVVPVQTGGSRRPFFFLHGHVIGGAFYSFALSRCMGPDQPFYVLDPYRFASEHATPTLEEMAAEYVKSLLTVQPEGPYLLGGFCGGGIIAFEMAQQLLDQGQEVDLLVLIEPRYDPTPMMRLFRRLLDGFIRRAGSLVGLGREKQLELFLRIRYLGLYLVQPSYRLELPFRAFPAADFLRTDWIGIFIYMLSQYTPRPYPGKVTYLCAREEPSYLSTLWGKIAEAKELEVHLIPGTHDTCRTDHLQDLAAQLQSCVCRAQTTGSGS